MYLMKFQHVVSKNSLDYLAHACYIRVVHFAEFHGSQCAALERREKPVEFSSRIESLIAQPQCVRSGFMEDSVRGHAFPPFDRSPWGRPAH